jgi:centromere protein S
LQRLKAAIDLTVHDILGEVAAETGCTFTPESSATISELVAEKGVRVAGDLQAFAQHARRQAVAGEDVRLLTRRNPELVSCTRPHESWISRKVGGKKV